jgi:hypothetical protein
MPVRDFREVGKAVQNGCVSVKHLVQFTANPKPGDIIQGAVSIEELMNKRPQHVEIWPCDQELPLTRSTKVDKLKLVELAGPIVEDLRNNGKWDARAS